MVGQTSTTKPHKIRMGGFDIDLWPDGFRINTWAIANRRTLLPVIEAVTDYYGDQQFGSPEAVIESYERDKSELRRAQIRDDLIVALNDFLLNGRSLKAFNDALPNRFGYILVGSRVKYSPEYGSEQYRRALDRLKFARESNPTQN